MAGEFLIEKVEWFDDVVVDQGRGRVRGTAFTPRMTGDLFEKWVVFHARELERLLRCACLSAAANGA